MIEMLLSPETPRFRQAQRAPRLSFQIAVEPGNVTVLGPRRADVGGQRVPQRQVNLRPVLAACATGGNYIRSRRRWRDPVFDGR